MRKKLIFHKTADQFGRSLVELLGVLAVGGVLALVGIYGFQYAMEKWRENETFDRYSKVVAGARTSRILQNKGWDTKYLLVNGVERLREEGFERQHVNIKQVISNVGDDDDRTDDDRPEGFLVAPLKGPYNMFNKPVGGGDWTEDKEQQVEIWVDVRTPSAFSVHAKNLTMNACKRIVQANLGHNWGYESEYDDISAEDDSVENWKTAPDLRNDATAEEVCLEVVKGQDLVLWFGNFECFDGKTCPTPVPPCSGGRMTCVNNAACSVADGEICSNGCCVAPECDIADQCTGSDSCDSDEVCDEGCCVLKTTTTTSAPIMTSEVTEITAAPLVTEVTKTTEVTEVTEVTTVVTDPECNEQNKCYSDEKGNPVCCSGEGTDICVVNASGERSCGCPEGEKLYCSEDNYTGSTCSAQQGTLTEACVWHTECIRWACTNDELMKDPTGGEKRRALEIPMNGNLEDKYPFCSLELLGKCAVVSYCDEPPVDTGSLWQHCPSCESYNPTTHVCMGSTVHAIEEVIDQESVDFLKHFYFKTNNEDEPCKDMVPTITTTMERKLKEIWVTTETIFRDAKTAQICFKRIDTDCIADACQAKGMDILENGQCCPVAQSWYHCGSCQTNPTYVDACGVTRTQANTCCNEPSNAPAGCVGVGQYDGTAKPGFLGTQMAQCYTNFPMDNGTCCAMVCASEDGGTEKVCCTGSKDIAYKGICCKSGSKATAACCEANGGQWAPRNAIDSISDDEGRDGQCCTEGAYIPVDSSMDIAECIECPDGESNPRLHPAPSAGDAKEFKYAHPQGGGTVTYQKGKVCCDGKEPYFDKESQSLACCKNIYKGTNETSDANSGFPIGICCGEGETGEEDEDGNLSCVPVTTIPETTSPYTSIPETTSPYTSIPETTSPYGSETTSPYGSETTSPVSTTSDPNGEEDVSTSPTVVSETTTGTTETSSPTTTTRVTETSSSGYTESTTTSVTETSSPTTTTRVTETSSPTTTETRVTETSSSDYTEPTTTSVTETSSPTTTTSVTETSSPTTTTSVTETSSPTTTTSVTETSSPTTTTRVTETSSPTTTTSVTETSSPTTTTSVTETSSPTTTTSVTETSSPTTTTSVTETSSPTTTTRVTETSSPTTTTSVTETSSPTTTTSVTETSSPTTTTRVTETSSPTTTTRTTETSSPTTTTRATETSSPTTTTAVVTRTTTTTPRMTEPTTTSATETSSPTTTTAVVTRTTTTTPRMTETTAAQTNGVYTTEPSTPETTVSGGGWLDWL